MASLGKQILEQEVEQLEQLHSLMREERECLARMDRETLATAYPARGLG